jgi:hypothetical protein
MTRPSVFRNLNFSVLGESGSRSCGGIHQFDPIYSPLFNLNMFLARISVVSSLADKSYSLLGKQELGNSESPLHTQSSPCTSSRNRVTHTHTHTQTHARTQTHTAEPPKSSRNRVTPTHPPPTHTHTHTHTHTRSYTNTHSRKDYYPKTSVWYQHPDKFEYKVKRRTLCILP